MSLLSNSGDGEVMEQVISQLTTDHEEATARRSVLDDAIRQLQEQQDRQSRPGTQAPEQAPAEAPAFPAPSTPRRGTKIMFLALFSFP